MFLSKVCRGIIIRRWPSMMLSQRASSMEPTIFVYNRQLSDWSRDPFRNFDKLFKDMENMFRCRFNELQNDGIVSRFTNPFAPCTGLSGIRNASTANKFKLIFNFPHVNEKDINITLKDRSLTVEASMEESTKTSKAYNSYKYDYEIPEGVDVEALTSELSRDGVLTVEAPRLVKDNSRSINIKREA